MRRLLYSIAVTLLLPAVVLRLLLRAHRDSRYLRHWGERFGWLRIAPRLPVIWLHAVSVGETRAAKPLVDELLAHYPSHQLVVTCMTPTGRQTSLELFGARVLRCYLPYDFPFAVARFLARVRPVIGIIMETEMWPNLFAACRKRGIPLFLANARMSDKSSRAYARFPKLARESFGMLAQAAAQSEADAQRLRALGVRSVAVLGNVKFDVLPPTDQLQAARLLRQWLAPHRVLLAASTREAEEDLILDALAASPLPERIALVLVPRHPQRFDVVEQSLRRRGIAYHRRSRGGELAPGCRVVLGDSLGEMFTYYAAADIAFVGGSLVPLGGQNLIEACAVGTPVLLGPHTYNFSEAAEEAVQSNAALRIANASQLLAAAYRLFTDEPRRTAMGQAGRAFAERHRGATARTVAHIESLLIGDSSAAR